MSGANPKKPPAPLAFVVVNVMLIALIPLLGVVGLNELLETKAGTFVEQPGPEDPGWEAFVDPSPLTLVVEIGSDGKVGGAALIAQPGTSQVGGAILLLPGHALIDGIPLSAMRPTEVADTLGAALRLALPAVQLIDEERWSAILGDSTVVIDNPDPILAEAGETPIPIGEVALDSSTIPIVLARVSESGPRNAIVVRRQAVWEALLTSVPPGEDSLAILLAAVAAGEHEVVTVPLVSVPNGVGPDLDATEVLVNSFVPFPAGSRPGDRIQVEVLDRAGTGGQIEAATLAGSLGFEVVAIGNAAVFDDLPTQLVVAVGTDLQPLAALIDQFGADTLEADVPLEATQRVTLLLNSSKAGGS